MSWLPARPRRPWSKASQWLWKEPVWAHAGLSFQAQQCPQAKRISFKAVPPGAQSQLWLWDVPKLICSLQSKSGTASPSWFCRLTQQGQGAILQIIHYPSLFSFFYHSLLVWKTEGLATCTLIQTKDFGLNSNENNQRQSQIKQQGYNLVTYKEHF